MNKTDLVKQVAKKVGEPENAVKKIMNGTFEAIRENLVFGIDVKISEFANFTVEVRKEKRAYNPVTEEYFTVPKKFGVKVKLSKKLTDKIGNKPVY